MPCQTPPITLLQSPAACTKCSWQHPVLLQRTCPGLNSSEVQLSALPCTLHLTLVGTAPCREGEDTPHWGSAVQRVQPAWRVSSLQIVLRVGRGVGAPGRDGMTVVFSSCRAAWEAELAAKRRSGTGTSKAACSLNSSSKRAAKLT